VSARRLLGTFALALLLAAGHASPALAEAEERPWAAGVSAANQERALALFQEGNLLFTESEYAAALGHYREALEHWSHPAIHYNAGVSLINLEQTLAAYEQIEAALAYGEAPLGTTNYQQAQLYKKLLFAQIAELEVSCTQPGVLITLDGTTLFVAPGSARRRLAPGPHQLVARKAGLMTGTHALDLPAGKLTREVLTLSLPPSPELRSTRRWDTWKPWAVVGSGVALGLVGVPLFISARDNFETYDAEVARLCPTGCPAGELPATVVDAQSRAELQHGLAVGMFAAGSAVTATGIVLVLLNQPRLEPAAPRRTLRVTPHVGWQSAGIAATLRY
jgi:hypothetical protein